MYILTGQPHPAERMFYERTYIFGILIKLKVYFKKEMSILAGYLIQMKECTFLLGIPIKLKVYFKKKMYILAG